MGFSRDTESRDFEIFIPKDPKSENPEIPGLFVGFIFVGWEIANSERWLVLDIM